MKPLLTVLVLLTSLLSLPLPARADDLTSLKNLKGTDARLEQGTRDLLLRLKKLRSDELERMRAKMLRDMDEWEAGLRDLDGKTLKAKLADAYAVAEGYGMNVPRLRGLYETSRKLVTGLEFTVYCRQKQQTRTQVKDPNLPSAMIAEAAGAMARTVLHFYETTNNEERLLACADRRRKELLQTMTRTFIRGLGTRDPVASLDAFEKYAANIRTLRQAETMGLNAEAEMVVAEQKVVVDFAAMVPFVGDAIDILALTEGEDLAGRNLTQFQESLTLVMLITPGALEQVFKRKPDAIPAVGRFLYKLARPKDGFVDSLIIRSGQEAEALAKKAGELLDWFQGTKTGQMIADAATSARAVGTRAADKASALMKVAQAGKDAAMKNLEKLGDVGQRSAAFAYGRANGEKLVKRLEEVLKGGSSLDTHRAMMAIQRDKHAMQVLKNSSPETIIAFNHGMDKLYGRVDKATKKTLVDLYLPGRAKAKGLDPDNLSPKQLADLRKELDKDIKIDLITNPSTGKVKPSFDRDVTARIRIGPGEEGLKDIPAAVLESAYAPAYYQAVRGGAPPTDEMARRLLDDMDQVATDALSRDAYGGSRWDLKVALEKNKVSVFRDPEQVGMVIADKGNHWFVKAEKNLEVGNRIGNPRGAQRQFANAEAHFEEGFRQLTKQYKTQVLDRSVGFNGILARKGQPPIRIPAKLRKADAILSQVGNGLTPAEATKALADMGMTPRDVSQGIGTFVAGMHMKMTKYADIPKQAPDILHFPSGWRTGQRQGRR